MEVVVVGNVMITMVMMMMASSVLYMIHAKCRSLIITTCNDWSFGGPAIEEEKEHDYWYWWCANLKTKLARAKMEKLL